MNVCVYHQNIVFLVRAVLIATKGKCSRALRRGWGRGEVGATETGKEKLDGCMCSVRDQQFFTVSERVSAGSAWGVSTDSM